MPCVGLWVFLPPARRRFTRAARGCPSSGSACTCLGAPKAQHLFGAQPATWHSMLKRLALSFHAAGHPCGFWRSGIRVQAASSSPKEKHIETNCLRFQATLNESKAVRVGRPVHATHNDAGRYR